MAETWFVLRFPKGMDMNWALDVQSAQTLDFYAAMHGGKVAWDLGTLTGISAAVLSTHMKKVTRRAFWVESYCQDVYPYFHCSIFNCSFCLH